MIDQTFDTFLFLIFFIYGLSFMGMGLVLALESGRSLIPAEARILRPLAAFGIIHGTHEWLEAYLLQTQVTGILVPGWLGWLRLGMLAASFTSLLMYGIRVFARTEYRSSVSWKIGLTSIFLYSGIILVSAFLTYPPAGLLQLEVLDVLSRYLLAVPGAILAALAMQFQSRIAPGKGQKKIAINLRVAAIGFGIYAFSQVFVHPLEMIPANILNTELFRTWTGLPIQALRTAMAVVITGSIFRSTQQIEQERKEQLEIAQQARLEALERVQKELADKESLRRELLRHIVQAQEDERARIARELHDETAQTLAAFSFDLAALQAMAPDKPECKQVSSRLQALSKEMSRGLYRLVHDLRPAQLDDLGLVPALQYLVEQDVKANGLDVRFGVEGTVRRLDAVTETVLFRVTQEALINVIRHSGTKQAVVSLVYKAQEVILTIQDSGIGFDPNQNFIPPHGWGLAGIKERVEAVGGNLTIEASPGNGTVIRVAVHVFDLIP